ncbi:MAG: glutamate racemase [Lachnospiraceae bacterium]|nr:glutamate racemase [Lachnospiraceae bacterium]
MPGVFICEEIEDLPIREIGGEESDISAESPIGVFDSGLGGLTVAREIMRNLPNERIVYFGDTARVPYGNKSKATIERYSRQIVRFLKTQDIKAVVVACNTATALAIDEVRRTAGIPVIGVIEPGAKMAVKATKNKRIGVIATRATIQAGEYASVIRGLDPEIRVLGQACPMLVPLVEEGWIHDRITDEIILRYLDDLLEHGVDTLILGCTHYPLLRSEIRKLVGGGITLINPAYETAIELGQMLSEQGLRSQTMRSPEEPNPYRFFVSDDAGRFTDFANSILPVDVKTARVVPIEEY